MNYLLSAQILLDLSDPTPSAASKWVSSVNARSLRVSVISIAEASCAISNYPVPGAHLQMQANLLTYLSKIRADAGDPLAFDMQHAKAWVLLLTHAPLRYLGATQKQVYAVAMHEGLTVVERRSPHTQTLKAANIPILDL